MATLKPIICFIVILVIFFFLVLVLLFSLCQKGEARPGSAEPHESHLRSKALGDFFLEWKNGSISGPEWGKEGSVPGGGEGRFNPPKVLDPIKEERESASGSEEGPDKVVDLENSSTPCSSPPLHTPSQTPARLSVDGDVTVATAMESNVSLQKML